MRFASQILSLAMLATLLSGSANAAGPFNLFHGKSLLGCNGCDSAPGCDSDSCDNACDSMGSVASEYFSISGGWTSYHDYVGENDNVVPVPPTLRGTFEDGFGLGFACGRRLNRAIRAEFEFAFRNVTGED
ncbi:MAG: hypothetical protein AAF989_17010, partial [Planctomycetota bacterium]